MPEDIAFVMKSEPLRKILFCLQEMVEQHLTYIEVSAQISIDGSDAHMNRLIAFGMIKRTGPTKKSVYSIEPGRAAEIRAALEPFGYCMIDPPKRSKRIRVEGKCR